MPCTCQTPSKTISVHPADPKFGGGRYLNAGTYTVDDAGYLRIFGTDDLLCATHAPGAWGSVDVDIDTVTCGACSCNDKLLNEPLKVGYTWRLTDGMITKVATGDADGDTSAVKAVQDALETLTGKTIVVNIRPDDDDGDCCPDGVE